MAKDPNYDRYAGIESLPGPDGKLPRPFRVDEDGNVIYRDEEHGIGRPMAAQKARDLARAGILDWDELDRKLPGKLAKPTNDVFVTAPSGSAGLGGTGSSGAVARKTIGGIDYNVISANTYDPALSNGKTAMPNANMIDTMNAARRQVAVTDDGPEKATRIVRLPFDFGAKTDNAPPGERNLPLINPKAELYYSVPAFDTKPGSTRTASTLRFGRVPGTVAAGHGHPDGNSEGMADDWDPSHKPKPIYGDVHSLLSDDPIPMATISRGRIGWHQLEDGRLQFMYPVGSFSESHEDRKEERQMIKKMQENLDRQQSLFHRK